MSKIFTNLQISVGFLIISCNVLKQVHIISGFEDCYVLEVPALLPSFLLTLSSRTIFNCVKTARGGFSGIIIIVISVIKLVKYLKVIILCVAAFNHVLFLSHSWMMYKWWTIVSNCSSLNLKHRNFCSATLSRHLWLQTSLCCLSMYNWPSRDVN